MSFSHLLFANYSGAEFTDAGWNEIDDLCESKILMSEDDPEFSRELARADGVLLKLGKSADATRIDSAPNLRYIGMLGTGYGNIDTRHAASREIAVCNVADYSTQGVAEFAVGVIIAELRELHRARNQAADGNYSEDTFTGTEISGKSVAIVGLGHIGRRTAELLSAFGASVSYWSRTDKSVSFASFQPDLRSLLSGAHIVSLHLALNDATAGIIGNSELAVASDARLIVNTAPMELFAEGAVEAWLGDRPARTLALDHSDELSADQAAKLSRLTNCVFYPPIAYTTEESTAAKEQVFIRGLRDFLAGSPSNKVN